MSDETTIPTMMRPAEAYAGLLDQAYRMLDTASWKAAKACERMTHNNAEHAEQEIHTVEANLVEAKRIIEVLRDLQSQRGAR